jgi:putative endonuclease
LTDRSQRLGQAGERLAAEHLRGLGYEIIDRNVRRAEGEIDLVAIDDGTLVFVEVKLRTSRRLGGAVSALSDRKKARMVELANAYLADHPELPALGRIDLVGIDLRGNGEVGEINHIHNAVEE